FLSKTRYWPFAGQILLRRESHRSLHRKSSQPSMPSGNEGLVPPSRPCRHRLQKHSHRPVFVCRWHNPSDYERALLQDLCPPPFVVLNGKRDLPAIRELL